MEPTGTQITLGIFAFEILAYLLILLFFGTYAAMIVLSIDIALCGALIFYVENFYQDKK